MATSSRKFAAPYDRTTKIVSAAGCGVLLAVAVLAPHIVFRVAAILIVGLTYAFSPRGYEVTAEAIVVRRLIGNKRLPLAGVRAAGRVDAGDLRGAVRLWGSGGMFGYYGLFQTSRLGRCWWYVTDRKNAVAVAASGGTVVFSPDDVEGFLAAVPLAGGAPLPDEAFPGRGKRRGSRRPAVLWIGGGVVLAAAVLASLAITYSPGPPKLDLTARGLTIHDRFYPVSIDAAAVDVARIRVVDLDVDTAWRPTVRTDGFANAHYRSGWFRTVNGQKVRLYQAGRRRLVLFPPKGDAAPVLLEVSRPEDFVEQVRGRWRGGE